MAMKARAMIQGMAIDLRSVELVAVSAPMPQECRRRWPPSIGIGPSSHPDTPLTASVPTPTAVPGCDRATTALRHRRLSVNGIGTRPDSTLGMNDPTDREEFA